MAASPGTALLSLAPWASTEGGSGGYRGNSVPTQMSTLTQKGAALESKALIPWEILIFKQD